MTFSLSSFESIEIQFQYMWEKIYFPKSEAFKSATTDSWKCCNIIFPIKEVLLETVACSRKWQHWLVNLCCAPTTMRWKPSDSGFFSSFWIQHKVDTQILLKWCCNVSYFWFSCADTKPIILYFGMCFKIHPIKLDYRLWCSSFDLLKAAGLLGLSDVCVGFSW